MTVFLVWFAEDVQFEIRRVTVVEPGLPMDFKKKMFGLAPKADRTLCLKDGGSYVPVRVRACCAPLIVNVVCALFLLFRSTLAHLQMESVGEARVLEACFIRLCRS